MRNGRARMAGARTAGAWLVCAALGACSGEDGSTGDPAREGDGGGGGGGALDASRPPPAMDAATTDPILGARVDVALAVVGSELPTGAGFAPRRLPGASFAPPIGLTTAALSNFENVYAIGGGLTSLKLYITTIVICEDIERMGTGYGRMTGCLSLHQGPAQGSSITGADVAAAISAANASDEGFIDVMDPDSRDQLSQTVALTDADARSYAHGMISWATPVKVKATLVDPADGTTPVMYTKASAPGTCQVNSNPEYDCAVTEDPLTSPPAEEAVFANHLDVIFKFQRPFTISPEDIAAGKHYALALAFNPHGLVQGVASPGATNFPPLTDNTIGDGYNVGNSISLVGAQLAPIFYASDVQVLRESYIATLPHGGGGSHDLRIELYTLSDDPTVYGVSTATIPNADTDGYLVGYHTIYEIETNADDSINLLDYEGTAQISDFTRVTSEGATTTAKMLCEPVNMACTAGDLVDVTFRLDALEPIDAADYSDPDQ